MSTYLRGKVWWVRFQWKNETIRRSARTSSRRHAEEFERDLREAYRKMMHGKPRKTYKEAMGEFVAQHLPSLKPSARRRYGTSIDRLTPRLGDLYLDQITTARLREFVAYRRREGVKDATIRRDLACLSSMFTLAVSEGWADANPVKNMDKRSIRESAPRTRYLSHNEETMLIYHAGAYLWPMVAFAINTGLRLEEQLSLEWSQVDLRRGEIFIPNTKTDMPRTVQLLPRAAQILAQRPVYLGSPYVFVKKGGERYGKLTRGLAGACQRAGIKDLKWHDLRRTCGCRLLQDHGLDIFKVRDWLGHKSVAVTERSYSFLGDETIREALRVGTKVVTGAADSSFQEGAKSLKKMVPRGGIEPPTRGFSVPGVNGEKSRKP